MPKIIGVVTFKRLMDNPNERSSHSKTVPSLGGVAFYICLVLGMYFLRGNDYSDVIVTLMPGLLILFVIGLKDDLVVLSPLTKLGAQIASICFVLSHSSFHIKQLHGFLGFEQISLFLSIPLAAFLMITIINAFNLIDGIDGLASIVGIVVFSIYSILFFMMGLYFFSGMSVLMIGSLLAFLRFNLSSSNKIFMGDTGSLLIGFIIAVMTIRFFSLDDQLLKALPIQLENLPLLVLAILVVPFFDTTRVFTLRIMNKKGPFSPDRNHIHHLLIDYLHLSHRKASLYIGVVNFLFIVVFFILGANFSDYMLLLLMTLLIFILVYFFYRINFSYSNMRRKLRMKRKWDKFKDSSNIL
jgi:UDP-N-acetylmuramyl pentapeptide phosphotransferase/UDP-N-acetylglucosamine-1-phosphate transferase